MRYLRKAGSSIPWLLALVAAEVLEQEDELMN